MSEPVTTILVVEDNPDDLFLIEKVLAKVDLDRHVRVVRDGVEAAEYLEGAGKYADRERFPRLSLVLLDLKLPRKSGLEVLEWLRGDPALKATPVVVLTSSSEPTDIDKCHALGVNAYLVKPVRFADLLELVKGVGMYWMILNRSEAPGKRA